MENKKRGNPLFILFSHNHTTAAGGHMTGSPGRPHVHILFTIYPLDKSFALWYNNNVKRLSN